MEYHEVIHKLQDAINLATKMRDKARMNKNGTECFGCVYFEKDLTDLINTIVDAGDLLHRTASGIVSPREVKR